MICPVRPPRVVLVAALVIGLVGSARMQERRTVTAGLPVSGPFSAAVQAGGLIYAAGVTGIADTPPPDGANVMDETKRAFERLRQVLEAAGSSLANLVNVTVYLKRAADFDPMNAVYRTFVSDAPPARTTVATDLPGGALIQISAIAVPAGAVRETLLPAGWIKSPRPYSYIVRTSDLVFFSGLVSRRGTDDQVVPGSIAVQMRTILANAGVLLKTAGVTVDDVVSARVFVTDDSYFDGMNAEYLKTFASNPPARAAGVAALMGPDNNVELTLIASRTPKEVIGPLVSPTLPVSTAVRAGRRVFVSGVVGNTDANPGDLASQTREALVRVKRALDLAGLTLNDVVDTTIYLRDPWQVPAFDDVYRDFFPTEPPARTIAGVKTIARSALAEFLMTAYR